MIPPGGDGDDAKTQAPLSTHSRPVADEKPRDGGFRSSSQSSSSTSTSTSSRSSSSSNRRVSIGHEDGDGGGTVDASRRRSRSRNVAVSRRHSSVNGTGSGDIIGGSEAAVVTGTATGAASASQLNPATTGPGPAEFEVAFGMLSSGGDGDAKSDPLNPHSWPLWYRAWAIFNVSFATWVVVLYSTSYTAAIPGMMAEFGVASESVVALGVTTYLVGLAVGSLVVAPMSELYGRRPVYLLCQIGFAVMIVPCALAKSLTEVIVFRFVGAIFGSAMVSNSPGSVVDLSDEEHRALTMSLWSIAPLNGPVTGPLIGGFVYDYLGWRWDNWVVLIIAGFSTLLMLTVRETYAPAILKGRARQLRKETGDSRWWCRYEQSDVSTWELIKLNLSRPFVLSFTEPILWFFNIWISIIYGILYLCFVSYPIVYSQIRGWSPGISGLAFVGMGIGTMISILSEPLIRRLINSHPKDPETGRPPPEATASVMTIGAILTPIGQLVFAWTCVPPVHWAVGIAFGIPFGAGNTLSFIYGSNYLAGAYGIYAASALAGNAVMRSIFGGTLPLVAPAMYRAMTPQWAGTFLGLLQVALIPIPFVFYRYGARIRAKSKVIQQLREDGIRNEGQIVRSERRPRGLDERHTATAVAPGGRRGGDEQDVDGGDEDLISPVSDGGHGLDEKDPKKGREWEAERDAVAKSWKEKDTAAV